MSSTGFPDSVIKLVEARSGGACEVMARGCAYRATQYHHRRPRGMGGDPRESTNAASNCLHVCQPCHAWVESQRVWALERGFLVGQEQDPCLVPVQWRCVQTCVLFDDAGKLQIVYGKKK